MARVRMTITQLLNGCYIVYGYRSSHLKDVLVLALMPKKIYMETKLSLGSDRRNIFADRWTYSLNP